MFPTQKFFNFNLKKLEFQNFFVKRQECKPAKIDGVSNNLSVSGK